MYTAEQLIEKLNRARNKAINEKARLLSESILEAYKDDEDREDAAIRRAKKMKRNMKEGVPVIEKPPMEMPNTNSGDSGYDRRMNLVRKSGDDDSLEKYGNKIADDADLQR